MKTLKEELQQILDDKKLTPEKPFICNLLSGENDRYFQQYKDMAKDYAKEYFNNGYAWWTNFEDDFVITEKYRFIRDLIAILP